MCVYMCSVCVCAGLSVCGVYLYFVVLFVEFV